MKVFPSLSVSCDFAFSEVYEVFDCGDQKIIYEFFNLRVWEMKLLRIRKTLIEQHVEPGESMSYCLTIIATTYSNQLQ